MPEVAPIAELPRKIPTIEFLPNEPKYNMQAREFTVCWQAEGPRIVQAFQTVTNLQFTEPIIKATVGRTQDGYSHVGKTLNDPMEMNAYSKGKIGTTIHELTHRLIREYGLYDKAKVKFGFKNEHQLLDLIYYDVLKNLYGEPVALERARYESGANRPKYKECWDWFFQLPVEERERIKNESLILANK